MHFWYICKKIQNKDFGGVIVQKQYDFKEVLWSYVLKNLDIGSSLRNIGFVSCIFVSQRRAKKFANNLISACDFCKDMRKFACFGSFRCKGACLTMKTMKKQKFDTYWLTQVLDNFPARVVIRAQVGALVYNGMQGNQEGLRPQHQPDLAKTPTLIYGGPNSRCGQELLCKKKLPKKNIPFLNWMLPLIALSALLPCKNVLNGLFLH